MNNTQTVSQATVEQRLAAFEKECRHRGLRVTEQRRAIFRAVAASTAHPCAEAVYETVRQKMPNVSLDTVYRTLASLEEMDLLMRVGLSARARFDGDMRPHCHFVCTQCGEVYDIFLKENETLLTLAGASQWGEVKQVNMQLRGVCNKCRAGK